MNPSKYSLLAKRLSLVLVLYSLSRAYFLVSNLDYFRDVELIPLAQAFLLGLKFDVIAITAINLPFIIISIFPFQPKQTRRKAFYLKVYFLITNILFLLFNLSDAAYFPFTGKRTTYDIVNISSDIIQQSSQLALNFWYIPLIALTLGVLLAIVYPKAPKLRRKSPLWISSIIFLLLVGVCILILRGSLERRPITLKQAFAITPSKLGNLVLNTPFSFFYTIQSKGVEKKQYFSNELDVFNRVQKPIIDLNKEAKKKNIVLIILESFGREYIGYGNPYEGYTPFLDSLSKEATFFHQCYANGRKSIEALPAILAGIPALMDEPYINSIYQNNEMFALGNILQTYGYHTSFYHGGVNGTMAFDSFAKLAGMKEYYGMNEYPNKDRDFDGKWGIFDEPFLHYFAERLSETPQPFCTGIFTLTSHQPYPIPTKYINTFPKGTLPIHETIGYTDNALRTFFDKAKNTDWYANTLFVITADHTQQHYEESYMNENGNYLVPLIFYNPNEKITADTQRVTQHADILPSVLDYLDIPLEKQNNMGQSVFLPTEGYALNQSNGNYRLIRKNYSIEYSDHSVPIQIPNPFSDTISTEIKTPDPKEVELLKAYIQYFNNSLSDNKLYR
jgi:phosphoglycerol transferase MdoB-like AlkP superfamily enzyme